MRSSLCFAPPFRCPFAPRLRLAALRSLHCTPATSRNFARILPRISRISRMPPSRRQINSLSASSVPSVVQLVLIASVKIPDSGAAPTGANQGQSRLTRYKNMLRNIKAVSAIRSRIHPTGGPVSAERFRRRDADGGNRDGCAPPRNFSTWLSRLHNICRKR